MSLSNPKEMYRNAIEGHYALGAFNVFSLESIQAVLDAAENQKSPVILQVSMGARKYVKDFHLFVHTMKNYADHCAVPVFIQHDHCTTEEACFEAIDAGVQSVMFDGSHLAYDDNLKKTSEVVAYAHKRGVWVEAELGRIPGFEDLVFAESDEYTDPEMAHGFIAATGCDALAVSVGTSHGGVEAEGYLPMQFDLLRQIVSLTPDYPFVLHGGASLPPELIAECNKVGGKVEYLRNCSEKDVSMAVDIGIHKVNMDVDNFLVFTTAIRKFFLEKPSIYDPRKYLVGARAAFQAEVEHKFQDVLHSAGRR
ncbi:MAG: class II fructose-bisphosphate aldolase [Spirochaetia bacterium]|jgi:fructose-bisphosphate aldolase class II|nr:class II fructose-bisphosphate aldolase [Spirochaetia bacterium]